MHAYEYMVSGNCFCQRCVCVYVCVHAYLHVRVCVCVCREQDRILPLQR